MEELRVRRLKILLLVSSLVCLAFLLLAAFEENFTADWRAPQIDYARLLQQKAPGGSDTESTPGYPIELRQVFLKDWNRVDRCVSCHVGIDNPSFRDAEQPLTAHPGDLLEHHPVDRFGCTICHQGQGRATDKDGAHGRVPFWDQPLLAGDLVQATCAKCHHEVDVPEAPVLARGQRLLSDLGCAGCHQLGQELPSEKVGPPLSRTGSKVSRKWLEGWLTNPKSYLSAAKMPRYELTSEAVQALSAYLMTFRDPGIDSSPEPEGDHDAGNTIYREAQCIVCHVTKEDVQGKPVGGTIGPDLRKIGNKVNERWLAEFLKNPHAFQPNTKMPRYNFSGKDAADLAQFAMEDWVDLDLQDRQAKEPESLPDSPARIRQGKLLFKELGCAGCHDLTREDTKLAGPDLTFIGSRPVHELDFGNAKIRHALPDFLYAKLKSPESFRRDFQLPTWEKSAMAVWQNLRPAALFSDSKPLDEGSEAEQLKWILAQVQQAGMLDANLQMPDGSPRDQASWLTRALNNVGALSPLKMPDFQLSDEDAEALTIALMSHSEVSVPSKRYEVPQVTKVVFNPQDAFGVLERRYRCLSCHSIRGSGDRRASDLTYEGSRVHREWLYHYLNTPYSMRRTLTIAMPIFHFDHEDSHFMAEYMSMVFVDTQIGTSWDRGRDHADAQRGKALFDAKGCIACHQMHGKGGDVGPSLTTQVPEFPQGTWVGDKLKGGWIYQWLLDPQALVPDTLEPNLAFSDQEALDLTAYLLTLKNPDFQKEK
jgi:cbb3-type cytochrome oxidase cytochrome c subunit